MDHPLDGFEIEVSNFKCFGAEGSGKFPFNPISVIIGKNNSGKSTVLDLINICVTKGGAFDAQKHINKGGSLRFGVTKPISEKAILRTFTKGSSGGGVPGRSHWEYGSQFIDNPTTWNFTEKWQPELADTTWLNDITDRARPSYTTKLASLSEWDLSKNTLLRVAAERSVIPEAKSAPPEIEPNGKGVTNLIRAFKTSSELPRSLVERDLLNDINAIYLGDSSFEEIICQEDHDAQLEIQLGEVEKGDVRLSESGSSLQSVFIILSYFRLIPYLKKLDWKNIILAVEEPENNLHPAFLRRLLDYLAKQRQELGFSLVITTHSPVCIDWATNREDSGILHVKKEAERTRPRND